MILGIESGKLEGTLGTMLGQLKRRRKTSGRNNDTNDTITPPLFFLVSYTTVLPFPFFFYFFFLSVSLFGFLFSQGNRISTYTHVHGTRKDSDSGNEME